jgi:hypothetical protein
MFQSDVILVAKVYEILRSESSCIVGYDFSWTPKVRQDIIFQKFNNDRINSLPASYNFNPFYEIFRGSKNPFVLA